MSNARGAFLHTFLVRRCHSARDGLCALANCQLQYLGEMHRGAAGGLCDLLAAAEAVSDDDRVDCRTAYSWQENALATPHRDVVVLALEAEGASHAATPGIELLDLESELREQRQLVVHLHDCLVVAVPVH